MLERTSRFVLEVLPYLLTALIAAVVVPQFVYSQAHRTKTVVISNISDRDNVRDIRRDQAAFEGRISSDSRP